MKRKLQPGFSKDLLDTVKSLTDSEIEERRQRFEREQAARKMHTKRMKAAGIWL